MCPCFFPCRFLFGHLHTRTRAGDGGQAGFCSGSLSSFRRMSILAISTSGPFGRSWPFLTCPHRDTISGADGNSHSEEKTTRQSTVQSGPFWESGHGIIG